MNPTQLSNELRNASTPDLNRRRWIVGLSLVGVAVAKVVALYQTGIIKTLPDPPIDIFDSEKVDASDYAYKRLDTPDALMMITNYGVTAALAGAGGKNRAQDAPMIPIAMGVKTLIDTATALKLSQEEWQENKKLCFYCQIATVASIASLALSIPEVLSAVKQLQGKQSNGSGNGSSLEENHRSAMTGNATLVPSGTP
jgi:uncharacterized membrane protein